MINYSWLPAGLVICFVLLSSCAKQIQMNPGRKVIIQKCRSCHSEPKQSEIDTDVKSFLKEIHGDKINLTPEELQKIQKYLEEETP